MFRQINDVVLFVEDLEKSLTFYRDVVGLKLAMSDPVSHAFQFEGNRHLVILTIPAAVEMVGEDALSLGKAPVSRALLCTGVDDVDATYEALKAKGVTFIKPPVTQAWGRRTAYFADPSGNLWELWQEMGS